MAKRLFTSESVTEGHPDKVCDQISDAVLDDILAHDPNAHVACETFTTTGIVTVMGEITTKHYTDIPSIVRRTVERIGYTDPAYGFDYRSCAVMTAIDEQSPTSPWASTSPLSSRRAAPTRPTVSAPATRA